MSYRKPKADTSIFSDALALACGCRPSADYHPSADPEGLFGRNVTTASIGQYFGKPSASGFASSSEMLAIIAGLVHRIGGDTASLDVAHRRAAATHSLPDLKPATLLRLASGEYRERPSGAEARQIGMSLAGERVKLLNYAGADFFTRETLINSDFDGIAARTRELVAAGLRAERTKLFAVVEANGELADGTAQFDASRANVVTGAMSLGTLGEATTALRSIPDADGNALQLAPAVVLVPALHEVALRTVLEAAGWTGLNIIGDTRLTHVYLLPEPRLHAPFTLAYLDGKTTPIVGVARKPRSDDYLIRGHFDLAAVATSPRAVRWTVT